MSEEININKMISGSTSNVSVSDLSRQGFKKVKVLNQDMIRKMIKKAVDKVLKAREEDISEKARQSVVEKSKQQFQELLNNKVEEVRRERSRSERDFQDQTAELKAALEEKEGLKRDLEQKKTQENQYAADLKRAWEELEKEKEERIRQADVLRKQKEDKEEENKKISEELAEIKKRIAAGDQNSEKGADMKEMTEMFRVLLREVKDNGAAYQQQAVGEMKNSIEVLADRIAQGIAKSGGAGGGGGSAHFRNDASATDVAAALLSVSGGEKLESNIGKVGVKKGKAKKGVGSSLNKLKAMQDKGGD